MDAQTLPDCQGLWFLVGLHGCDVSGIYITAKMGGRITISKLQSKKHRDELSAELTIRNIEHVKESSWYPLTHLLKKHECGRLVAEGKIGEAASWKDMKSFEPIADEMKLLLGLG